MTGFTHLILCGAVKLPLVAVILEEDINYFYENNWCGFGR